MFYDDKFQFKVSRITYLKMVPSGLHLTSNFPHKIYQKKKNNPIINLPASIPINFFPMVITFQMTSKGVHYKN